MATTTPSTGDTPRVLFADSDSATRALFERLGNRFGWSCESVSDAAGVLGALAGRDFDILVTNLAIPQMSSMELLHALRGTAARDGGRRVIVVAPRELLPEADRWIREGASDVVMSPINIELLGAALQRAVEDLKGDDSAAGDPTDRFVASERGVWEITSRELATIRFPLHITERLYRSGRIDKNLKLRLHLAFQEALLNALDHGNLELESAWREEIDGAGVDRYSLERRRRLEDPHYADRKIYIETVLEGERLTLRIRDEGKGFTEKTTDAVATLPLCSGRGLAIIKGSVDEVHFARNGTEITLIKFLPG